MSSSISPWLSKAVEEYRNKHRVNLSFEHKGGYVQIVQFTSYRDKRKPEYDQLGVWAYVHDRQFRVLVKFEASAINEFERNHDSFTSYKGGLFQIRSFRFQYTSSYVDRVPSSAQIDFGPKERKIILSVDSFRYLSSKGEGDWSPSARNFDLLAAAWIRDIMLDEEEKKGNSIGGKSLMQSKPAQDDVVKAVADEARRKVMRKGGNARQAADTVHEASASTSTPIQDRAHATPLLETPSPSQNRSPDFMSARKLVQQQNGDDQMADGAAGFTPTRLLPHASARKAGTIQDSMMQTNLKRKRSLDEHDQFDLDSPEPEEMFTQFSEEAAPISDPPPPSSHASSRSASPASDDDGLLLNNASILGETQGLSVHTQERIRTLFRPSIPHGKTFEALLPEKIQTVSNANTADLNQVEQAIVPSEHTSGAKKRKKSRLPQFELSSQASDDEGADQTMVQNDEEPDVLPAEEVDEQERGDNIDTEMADVDVLQTRKSAVEVEGDMTVTIEGAIVINNEADQQQGTEGQRNLPRDSTVFETQSEASEAESASDEGFEFVKIVPGLTVSPVPFTSIVKQEPAEMEQVVGHQQLDTKEAETVLELDRSQHVREDTLEEDPDFVTSKLVEVDIDALLDSLNSLAEDENAIEYDNELQAVDDSPGDEAMRNVMEVYKTFVQMVQKDWFDRLATSKVNASQSGAKKRRPVYDDDAEGAPNATRQRSSSSGKRASDTLARQGSTAVSRAETGQSASLSPERADQSTSFKPQSRRKSSKASAWESSKGFSLDKAKPRGSSVASSAGQAARLSEPVQQQINETQALIKRHIRSIGLSMKDSVDLWYSCSGDFEVAKQIALHDVAKSQASESSQDLNILPLAVQTAYKSCWSYEDDQLVEKRSKDVDPQHQLDLADIELRRGKGSVEKRRLFLKEDPIAKRLPRKARYPFNLS